MKNLLKKNQIAIYIIALMLVTAGYLNFTSLNESEQTSSTLEEQQNTQVADIGDAALVNSNDVVENDTMAQSNNVSTNTVSENKQSENQVNQTSVASSTTENNVDENTTKQTNSTTNNSDYFTKSKLERETMYSQMLETYEKVLNSQNSLEVQKQSATEQINKINETKNSIMICENLIKTKGFENNLIFVNGDSVSVIIGGEELKQEEIAQIQNIISRELKAKVENIHIATK